jgi:hypothetical protein
MSGRICDDAANQLLAVQFKVSTLTSPTHLNIAASTADPLADGSGLVEPTDGAYSRVQVDAWTQNTGSRNVSNTNAFSFSAAGADQGMITHFAVIDNTGKFIASGPLTTPRAVGVGVVLDFAIGSVVVAMA